MFQRCRETRSHWNLPHCTKHLSPHSTLHSLSLYQLAAVAYSTNIHLCLPLWKIFLKWACPSICPCVTQLYLHKVSVSCIIREEIHFFFYLLSGSVFVPFSTRSSAPWERVCFCQEITPRLSERLMRWSHRRRLVWGPEHRGRHADISTVTPVSTIILLSDKSWTPWMCASRS